jgi:hypothetical protein
MVVLSDALQGAIVGGIIGFGSSVGVNLIKDYIKRPILSIGRRQTALGRTETVSYVGGADLGRRYPILATRSDWTLTRIIVENRGKTAAKNCKTSLITKGTHEERLGWMDPEDDFTVTINAGDSEYIDLCVANPEEGFALSTRHGFEKIIYQMEGVTAGQIKVTTSNTKQCVRKIWINIEGRVSFSRKYAWPERQEKMDHE